MLRVRACSVAFVATASFLLSAGCAPAGDPAGATHRGAGGEAHHRCRARRRTNHGARAGAKPTTAATAPTTAAAPAAKPTTAAAPAVAPTAAAPAAAAAKPATCPTGRQAEVHVAGLGGATQTIFEALAAAVRARDLHEARLRAEGCLV